MGVSCSSSIRSVYAYIARGSGACKNQAAIKFSVKVDVPNPRWKFIVRRFFPGPRTCFFSLSLSLSLSLSFPFAIVIPSVCFSSRFSSRVFCLLSEVYTTKSLSRRFDRPLEIREAFFSQSRFHNLTISGNWVVVERLEQMHGQVCSALRDWTFGNRSLSRNRWKSFVCHTWRSSRNFSEEKLSTKEQMLYYLGIGM